MSREIITYHVRMDARTFRRFAVFDTFRLKKRWRSPVLFAVIMTAFAIVCFAFHEKKNAMLLGSVLLSVGLSLPAVYFSMFFSSIKSSVKAQKLPRQAYDVRLGTKEEGVTIRSALNSDEVTLPWDKLHGAYRDKACIYLYALKEKAFLLPSGQADATDDEAWAFLVEHLPEGRTGVLR